MRSNVKQKFKGIYPALVSPYSQDGSINHNVISRLIHYQISSGVTGFFVTGTSMEMLLLSERERKESIDAVVKAVDGKAIVIAQVGMLSTKETLEMQRFAEAAGVDAVSTIPPIYFRYTADEILGFYNDVCAGGNLPLFVYNIPACTGVNLLQEAHADIFKLPRVIGVKESSANHEAMRWYKKTFPGQILLNGTDECLYQALEAGADGAVGSTYNLLPQPFIQLMDLYRQGKQTDARQLQHRCNALIDILLEHGGLPALKILLNRFGFACGNCREPFRKIHAKEKSELERQAFSVMQDLGVLPGLEDRYGLSVG